MAAHISQLTPQPGERALTFGGTRVGKSAFMEWEMRTVQKERPECMQILIDSKPRFRAEFEQNRLDPRGKARKKADKRYTSWAAGPMLPNSVVMDLTRKNPFRGMWPKDRPGEIVIMQSGESADWKRMLLLLDAFCRAQIKGRERRIVVDEVLDFYGRNTFGIDSRHDVFYRAARAGGERNIGLELGAHRVKGLPPLIRNMASRVTLFHLRDDSDMNELRQSVGITDAQSPTGAYVFRQWTIQPGGTLSVPFTGRCTYPESYLKQLSAT